MKGTKHILITGANGYLAQSVRALLAKPPYKITSLCRGTLKFKKQGNESVVLCDLLDKVTLKQCLFKKKFDGILHCASLQPCHPENFEGYLNSNVLALKNLLDVLPLSRKTIFIHFSSAVIYGNVRSKKINENSPVLPTNEYALSKLISEHILRIQTLKKEFLAYCLRLPSLHGNNQQGGLIQTYFEESINHRPLEIYSNGILKRNVMSFEEVANVCERILNLDKNPGFYLYQLGSLNSLSMKEIAEYIIKKTGSHSTIKCTNKIVSQNADWVFDLKKACQEIFFQPNTVESSLDKFLLNASNYESESS